MDRLALDTARAQELAEAPRLLLELSRGSEPLACFSIGERRSWLVCDPDLVGEVLVEGCAAFVEPAHRYAESRRLCAPLGSFVLGLGPRGPARPQLEQLCAVSNRTADALVERWARATQAGPGPVALEATIRDLFVVWIVELLYGVDIRDRAAAFVEALAQFEYLSMFGDELPEPQAAFDAVRAQMSAVARCVAERGRGVPDDPAAEVEAIRQTMLNGFTTTSLALIWALLLLAQNPEVQARARAELDAQLGGRRPTLADLSSLTLCRAIILESLRLYPPAWITGRVAGRELVLANERVAAGESVHVSPWTLHRDPRLWPEPDRFDPSRFLGGGGRSHRHAWLAFGAGPHACVAAHAVIQPLTLILARVLEAFELRGTSSGELVPLGFISLTPPIGASVIAAPRERPRRGC